MRSNSFEITGASARNGKDESLTLPAKAEVFVTQLNSLTPGCVSLMIGHPKEPAGGKLALWVDIDRATALRVSDVMLRALARVESVWAFGSAASVEAWDGAGKPYLSSKAAGFQVVGDWDRSHEPWHIQIECRSEDGTEGSAQVHFDMSNARILAELLRVMPFR